MNEQHTLDMVSLIFGLIFVIAALPVLLTGTPLHLDARWLWPTAVIVAGVLIAGSALRPRPEPVEQLPGSDDDTL